MKNLPEINVQIIHIQGPLKGEIQEFSDSKILVGRKSSCHVRFPKDLNTISRLHAKLVRDGNRFKIVDESSNGTFVNGKEVKEAFLKDGDVLMFAEGGPKVSFLTQVKDPVGDAVQNDSDSDTPDSNFPAEEKKEKKISLSEAITGYAAPQPQPTREESFENNAAEPASAVSVSKMQMPLTIQFGPTLRSFNELPVTIGNSPSCEYQMDHAMILPQHAQIFYAEDQYWVKDLTGKNLVMVNASPVQVQTPLIQDCSLELSPQGPKFKFIGQGRLIELEEPPAVPEIQPPPPEPEPERHPTPGPDNKGPKSILKKILQR